MSSRRSLLSAALSLLLCVGVTRTVVACEWGARALPQAREHYEQGDWGSAYQYAVAYSDGIDLAALLPADADPIMLEIQHIAAVAAARSAGHEGPFSRARGRAVLDDGDEQRNLYWAAIVLRHQLLLVERHPRRDVELAFALASLPYERAGARAILVELAARDLMPGAVGWALLSRLEAGMGDHAAARSAMSRCIALGDPHACEPPRAPD